MSAPRLPFGTWLHVFTRLFAVQGSYNYEAMIGNGIAFAAEPALRLLPGGRRGEAYRAAVARHSRYFNAHPYMAALAVGALVRAELDGEFPDRIERFKTACCGPLGAAGDRLVWASWLPFCSVLALLAYGVGLSAAGVVLVFVGTYNVGHVALRVWGLRAGYRQGLSVASALASPVLRSGPVHIARMAALIAGLALPLALGRMRPAAPAALAAEVAFAAVIALAIGVWQQRVDGWRIGVVLLVLFLAFTVVR